VDHFSGTGPLDRREHILLDHAVVGQLILGDMDNNDRKPEPRQILLKLDTSVDGQ
jgi:hypothetical protein